MSREDGSCRILYTYRMSYMIFGTGYERDTSCCKVELTCAAQFHHSSEKNAKKFKALEGRSISLLVEKMLRTATKASYISMSTGSHLLKGVDY